MNLCLNVVVHFALPSVKSFQIARIHRQIKKKKNKANEENHWCCVFVMFIDFKIAFGIECFKSEKELSSFSYIEISFQQRKLPNYKQNIKKIILNAFIPNR